MQPPAHVDCAEARNWDAPQRPFRIHGDTYYVGTRCLSAVLVASPRGHVLIDGGQPTSAPLVRANVEALGFRMADVKLLLNSHAHVDHAGGLAALQAASGAAAAAHPWAARVFRTGRAAPDDPQHGALPDFPGVRRVRVLADGEVVRVGPLALTAHFTPGHTPGGTSWSWTSCDGGTCRAVVYADSQTPVSAPGFRYTASPAALAGFARSQAALEKLRCEILITPHPDASSFWQRVEGAAGGGAGPTLVDAEACRRLAARSRAQLAARVEQERKAAP
jgi:metallo-beta-lactamase class B